MACESRLGRFPFNGIFPYPYLGFVILLSTLSLYNFFFLSSSWHNWFCFHLQSVLRKQKKGVSESRETSQLFFWCQNLIREKGFRSCLHCYTLVWCREIYFELLMCDFLTFYRPFSPSALSHISLSFF